MDADVVVAVVPVAESALSPFAASFVPVAQLPESVSVNSRKSSS
jgi:hypothetical protein